MNHDRHYFLLKLPEYDLTELDLLLTSEFVCHGTQEAASSAKTLKQAILAW